MAMIEVRHLTKEYGPVLAVNNITFQVEKGEIVGFLGLNGAGKTTTLRILTTYLPATSGVAKVASHDVMTESMAVRQNIGYLPENVPLYPEMRVEEYLDYRAKLKNVDRAIRRNRIDGALERCRIREVRRRLVGTLSKGYRQRVGLADTLVHDPPILILDEPTAGLDPLQRNETLHTIKALAEQHTVILSTHILSEVEQTCERVIIIKSGRLGLDRKLSDLEFSEQTIVIAEIQGPEEAVSAAMRGLEGVAALSSRPGSDGYMTYEIRTSARADPRAAVFAAVAKNGWTLRRLDVRKRKLDDYFLNLVRTDDVEVLDRTREPTPPSTAGSTAIKV
jgi:ABC-2 type transport system ATP-binding protein